MEQKSSNHIKTLGTPCFLVDFEKVKANADWMLQTCRKFGVTLRPHTKTHKTREGAELQTGGNKSCIAVSTLAEAEYYADCGFDDILLAHPFTDDKAERCLSLMERLQQFHVFVSNKSGLDSLDKLVNKLPEGKKWSVVIELDTGYARTGFLWDDQSAIHAAVRVFDSPYMTLKSAYTHCGDSYSTHSAKDRQENQERNIQRLLHFRTSLKGLRANCTIEVGTGSTPSCSLPIDGMKGLDEFHPGNYLFYDYQMVLLNACRQQDVACRVMSRVIDHKPEQNMLVIDCGFTALSHDGMAARPTDFCIIEGEANLRLVGMCQEVGKVKAKEGDLDCRKYPIGTILFLLPYHSCATAALHQVYHVHSGDNIVGTWTPVKGW